MLSLARQIFIGNLADAIFILVLNTRRKIGQLNTKLSAVVPTLHYFPFFFFFQHSLHNVLMDPTFLKFNL